eukprot:gene7418-8238_t
MPPTLEVFSSHKVVLQLLKEFYSWQGTLKEYLQHFVHVQNVDLERQCAILNEDCKEYSELLANTIVTCERSEDLVPKSGVSFSVFCHLDEIIYKVIGDFCKRNKQRDHVLSIGCSLIRPESKYRVANQNYECSFPNSNVSFISTSAWEHLFNNIGCDMMVHLLSKLSLFLKMPNGCLVQLSGRPVERIQSEIIENKIPRNNIGKISKSSDLPVATFNIAQTLHSSAKIEKLWKYHILRCVNDTKKDAIKLAANILLSTNEESSQEESNQADKQQPKLPKNLLRTVTFFREIIQKFKKLRIRAVLESICPTVELTKKLDTNLVGCEKKEDKMLLYKLAISEFTPPEKVFSFVKIVIRKTIPCELLGSNENWKRFYKHVARFVKLKQHEGMSLLEFMNGIKISDCTWMLKFGKHPKHVPESLSRWQESLVYKFVYWLIGDCIIPLIRSYFYVTESQVHHSRLFYYRKPLWYFIERLSEKDFIGSNFIEVQKSIAEHASLNCSKIRFVPKTHKTRPIFNTSKLVKKNSASKGRKSVNEIKALFHVLKYVKEQRSELIGSGVECLDEVNLKLRRYFTDLRQNKLDHLPLYYVASDIECCFDSIPHDKLIDIVEDIFTNYAYMIRKFNTVTFGNGRRINIATKQCATDDSDCDHFPVFIKKSLLSRKLRISNAIITDKVFYTTRDRYELVDLVKKHIKDSFVEVDKKIYQRVNGITQGSTLSTLLANLFYGHLENRHFNDILTAKDSLLMRWMDDYLLITTSEIVATGFLATLQAGFPEYGFKINVSKSLTNLPPAALGKDDEIKRLQGEEWFPWCSLLFNTKTSDVRKSFDRYKGEFISDSITQRHDRNPGKQLQTRLLRQVRTQSTGLLLDPVLNSLHNIKLNIYQIFCFVAIKLHCQVSSNQKHRQPNCNPEFYERLSNRIFEAFYSQYERVADRLRLKEIPIAKEEVRNVYIAATLNILGRKQARYKSMVKSLKKVFKRREINRDEMDEYEKERSSVTLHGPVLTTVNACALRGLFE